MNSSIYIGPETIMRDWNVSKSTAYNIIKEMNDKLKIEHPTAIIIPGKLNRVWYEEACLIRTPNRKEPYYE